ncbi:MAG: metallophosphoesterase [Cyanobacteria bacterium J06638_20]
MTSRFRFAILTDPHIALPETIWQSPKRFHLVEISIPAIEQVLADLNELDLDFLLIPGDLTQHGERQNHCWLADRLATLPYPAYVVPGNHDVIAATATDPHIDMSEFVSLYQKFGYGDIKTGWGGGDRPYYAQEILPSVWLIGLNSIAFDDDGKQHWSGWLDAEQFAWLETTLAQIPKEALTLVMVHHNVLEHLPGQSRHRMGKRYMLENAPALLELLATTNVSLLFTGHLHVQDIARRGRLYEITTGSLVGYPHPYRIVQVLQDSDRPQSATLQIESRWVKSLPGWEDLSQRSRDWMSERSPGFMMQFLTAPPISLSPNAAQDFLPDLRNFWADISAGDARFTFEHLPPKICHYLQRFSALDEKGNYNPIDNNAVLKI